MGSSELPTCVCQKHRHSAPDYSSAHFLRHSSVNLVIDYVGPSSRKVNGEVHTNQDSFSDPFHAFNPQQQPTAICLSSYTVAIRLLPFKSQKEVVYQGRMPKQWRGENKDQCGLFPFFSNAQACIGIPFEGLLWVYIWKQVRYQFYNIFPFSMSGYNHCCIWVHLSFNIYT